MTHIKRRQTRAHIAPSDAAVRLREANRLAKEAAALTRSAKVNPFDNIWSSGTHVTEVEYIIKGWLVRSHVSIAYAPPRSGKSWVAILMALCVATGTDFSGQPVDCGKVVYFAAENPDEVKRNIATQAKALGFDAALVSKNLHVIDAGIAITEAKIDQLIDGWERARSMPNLIIYDTFTDAAVQSLQSESVVTRAYDVLSHLAEQTQAHVLVLHHTKPSGQGVTGSSRILACFGDQISITAAEGVIRAEVIRLKGGEVGSPTLLQDCETVDGLPYVIELAEEENPFATVAQEITSYLLTVSASRAAVIARSLGLSIDAVTSPLELLCASKVVIRDAVTGCYSLS